MNARVLALSPGYQPVRTMGWQRAVTLLFGGAVELIEEGDEVIRSTRLEMKIPSVVRYVRGAFHRKQAIRFSRANVLARDGYKCQYCGGILNHATVTYDHVIPRKLGGRTDWNNVVAACRSCNATKQARTPEQAKMRLKVLPKRPESAPGLLRVAITWEENMPPSWRAFVVDTGYWHGKLEQT